VTWHPAPPILAAYTAGALGTSQAWSVEAHVAECAVCRAAVAAEVDAARLESIWETTAGRLDVPRPRVPERALVAVGVPEHLARLLGATPSLTVPWLLAVVTVLGFALAMAWSAAGDTPLAAREGLLPFLLLAPLVPVAGVAAAFTRRLDPAHEIAAAAPLHTMRLLLVRTVAVLATSLVPALAMALLLPRAGLTALAWILPALALASAALALTTFVSPVVAGAVVGVGWVTGVLSTEIGSRTLVAFGPVTQWAALVVVALSAVVMARRRDVFEMGRRP
jgi:hypothetical protein